MNGRRFRNPRSGTRTPLRLEFNGALTRLIPLLPDKMAPADTNIEESAGGMP